MQTASVNVQPARSVLDVPIRDCLVPDFHGAAIIGTDGRETPITEEMVRTSLAKMHFEWCKRKADHNSDA